MYNRSVQFYTLIGYLALLMWAFGGVFTAEVKDLPIFQTLSLVFGLSFGLTALKLTLTKSWRSIRQPWFLWLIGITGMFGNEYLFIAAFKVAPAVQVDLINYLWPILVVLFSCCLPRERFKWKYLLAASVSFYGIFELITEGKGLAGFQLHYWQGYLLALAEAIIWAIYTVIARHYPQVPSDVVGLYYGASALLALILHSTQEVAVNPHPMQWLTLILMGLTTQGAAYILWDRGVKQGSFRLLSILSYGNPILSVSFLIAFGFTHPTPLVFKAATLVTLGALIAGVNWAKYWRKIVSPMDAIQLD